MNTDYQDNKSYKKPILFLLNQLIQPYQLNQPLFARNSQPATRLNIQHTHFKGIILNKLSAGFNLLPH